MCQIEDDDAISLWSFQSLGGAQVIAEEFNDPNNTARIVQKNYFEFADQESYFGVNIDFWQKKISLAKKTKDQENAGKDVNEKERGRGI